MLDEPIHNSAIVPARKEIIHQLWRGSVATVSRWDDFNWDAYFVYYTKQCCAALVDEGKHLSARTHYDVLKIAHLLEDEPTREEVERKLRQTLTQQRPLDDENRMLDGSIKLATRLHSMIDIGPLHSEISGRISLRWNKGSLKDAVQAHFQVPSTMYDDETVIEIDFTARNIASVSGIEIMFTDNIADHLRLVEGDKKLCVFHQVTFLKWVKSVSNSVFPQGFVEETLDTLALLFPQNDRKTKQWLGGQFRDDPSTQIDRDLLKCSYFRVGHPSRRLQRFRYWYERLGMLIDTAEEATPPSKVLLKALGDSKSGERWLNSWVAMVAIGLTLFFGLVQSIEGAMQVYKAYHPVAT